MRAAVVTLFPDLVRAFAGAGLIRRAVESGALALEAVNPRDFATDRHRTVDDAPFGGGAGMVMKPEPLVKAVRAARRKGDRVVLLSPQGTPLTDAKARALAKRPGLVLVCGRYEGVDERVREAVVDEELSIGDYVLMGGELPALVVLEAVARFLPGVLGNAASADADSFARDGLLDHPHYTRPADYLGRAVPAVLTSGDHAAIEKWRRRAALLATAAKRPDLLEGARLTAGDRAIIADARRGRQRPAAARKRRTS